MHSQHDKPPIKTPQTILDIDLDIFLSDVALSVQEGTGVRLDEKEYKADNIDEVLAYCLNTFKISPKRKIEGFIFDYHKDAFSTTKRLIDEKRIVAPIDWIHVDAHDDLYGCSPWNKPGREVNSGNFLGHIINNAWLSKITFIMHPRHPSLACYTNDGCVTVNNIKVPIDIHYKFSVTTKMREHLGKSSAYALATPPDFLYLTRSPEFTPRSADHIFERLKECINTGLGKNYFAFSKGRPYEKRHKSKPKQMRKMNEETKAVIDEILNNDKQIHGQQDEVALSTGESTPNSLVEKEACVLLRVMLYEEWRETPASGTSCPELSPSHGCQTLL